MIICDSCHNRDTPADPISDYCLSFYGEEDFDDESLEEETLGVDLFSYNLQLCPKCRKYMSDGVRYVVEGIVRTNGKQHPEVQNDGNDPS